MLDQGSLCCMEKDWRLVAAVIKAEAARRGLGTTKLAELIGRHRTYLTRLDAGQPVEQATLRRVEGALGLPRDLLSYVADHDLAKIGRTSADPDLVTWLTNEMPAVGGCSA